MNQLAPISNLNGLSENSEVASKGDIFRVLSQNIPLNDYRLPDFIYRADLVGEDIFTLSPKDKLLVLEAATIPLSFEHGYPAIYETAPIWEQLPSEPADAYDAYMAFLELPQASKTENPIRLLPMIATITGKALKTITDWCHLYYWHWRARAYDLFLIACHRKQKEQRIMSLEGAHYKMADELLEKIQKLAHAKLDQEIAELSEDASAQTDTKIKDLISMSKDLMQVQRISVGLPAAGPSNLQIQLDGPRHTTVGETLKHIAKEGAGEDRPKQRSAEMDVLLQNPDELSAVQELMIKLHRPDVVVPSWGAAQTINPNDPNDPNGDGAQEWEDAEVIPTQSAEAGH
jgi:hypothetical protein